MLRGLQDGAVVAFGAAGIQGLQQGAHLAAATQLAHARGRVADRAGHPAQHHLAIAPTLDVATVVRHRAVQVLDRVGRAQRAVQRAGDAQRLGRQRLFQAFAQAGGGARMLGLQGRRQAAELLARQIGVRGRPGILQGSLDAGMRVSSGRCSSTT